MNIYILITHLWEEYELVGVFTDEKKFIEAYEKLEKRNSDALKDIDYLGDIDAFCVEPDKTYDETPPDAWVYQGKIETHNSE